MERPARDRSEGAMSYQPPTPPEVIAELAVHCPECDWRGRGADTNPQQDDLLRCPKCKNPVTADVSQPERTRQ